MPNDDSSVESRPAENPNPPAPSGGEKPVAAPIGGVLLSAAVAVAAGGVVLVVAIFSGAAEAAVSVAAAYLVYNAVTERTDLSGTLAVRLLTAALRRPPARS